MGHFEGTLKPKVQPRNTQNPGLDYQIWARLICRSGEVGSVSGFGLTSNMVQLTGFLLRNLHQLTIMGLYSN